jgi:uncharacterized repeat protein (TIGR01451 family)
VNFDSPGDLSNNFVINGSTGNFAQVASGGITGGAVDVLTNDASDTAIYKTAVSNAVGQTVSASIFFRYSKTIRDYNNTRFPIEVGFTTSTTISTFPSFPYQADDAGAHIQASSANSMFVVGHVQNDAHVVGSVSSSNDLIDGHWYRFTLDLKTVDSSSGALSFKTFLQDYGADGETPAASRVVGSATINSTKVAQATQLYACFYAQKDGGTDLLDNFSVMNSATPPMGGDLELALSADRNPVPVGRNVIYTATITNNGPSDSADVTLRATLPSGELFQDISCDGACASNIINNSITTNVGTISVGGVRHVYITAQVQQQGSLTVNGSVASSSTPDENSQNNSASFTTTRSPAPPIPLFSTAVQPSSITLGASTKDVASLSNGASPTGTITFKAYSPFDTGCNSTPAFTSTVTVNGNGNYTSATFTPSATGTYRFIASYTGDDNNGAITGTCGAANESVTVSPAPTPTPTPTSTATPKPTATPPSQALNISTRMEVLSENNVLIAGLIVTGPAGSTKKVILRGLGPSLANSGIANPLSDPLLELHEPDGTVITNDNWQDASNSGDIPVSFRPGDPRESVIVATLPIASSGSSNFTAILRGAHGEVGVGLAEAYDLDQAAPNQFANISTRGFVDTGNNVMIGGFILGGSNQGSTVIIRALGPSLTAFGVGNALADPTLELHDGNGTTIKTNDNWKTDDQSGQSQEAAIRATTLPPSNDQESAILATLPPGAYTAVVAGKNSTTGVGLVEAYNLR